MFDLRKAVAIADDRVDFAPLEVGATFFAPPTDIGDVAADAVIKMRILIERLASKIGASVIKTADYHNSFPYYPAAPTGVRSLMLAGVARFYGQ